jgi:hypothetical protein
MRVIVIAVLLLGGRSGLLVVGCRFLLSVWTCVRRAWVQV